ncbi:glycosyltransferase involved in cell wall biosynthesis [Variovorax boronicumulans]|uniref:Glycosyltransferase involved in cell wall biosynthesis n=1 Tax=Variovorax boronicumulans TaxID=436515 RepID=A0AAW8D562_9BURK|nr:glycosyltransferase family 2 protein [Variovorax boronicumulans]MDP9895913.1 glycosyltransferase involved in cell wall biosynthesis [Variovorax boronicumulans]MDQ0055953.1 glycosyltransferase involved in cell wall biosynthesis [Variovorax boronicumulans]
MIGVVIPAHNEGERIGAALDAVLRAAAHPALEGKHVGVVVVLDSCSDATEAIAMRHHGVARLKIDARNVGIARARGADFCIGAGARWLAFTDADTIVSPDWLEKQLAENAEVVCGVVDVADWSAHGLDGGRLQSHFVHHYVDADGHRHVHGANLGVATEAYCRVGGFEPLACSEDAALVDALEASGARIAWSTGPRVTTSARTDARARGGFGDTLLAMVASLGVTPSEIALRKGSVA